VSIVKVSPDQMRLGWIAPSPGMSARSIWGIEDLTQVLPPSLEESVKHSQTPKAVSVDAGATMVPSGNDIGLFFTGPRPPGDTGH
jgi:hypothetical protein